MPARPVDEDSFDEDLPDIVGEAEAAVAELTETFLASAGESLREARRQLALARAEPAAGPAAVRSIYGIAHNIKGQGGSFGYDLASEIAAQLSAYIRGAPGPLPPAALEVVEIHLAAIGFVLDRRIRGGGGALRARLLGKLRKLAEIAGPPGER